jgi:hypothetical protein
MVCDPRSRVHLKCPTLSTAYSRSITHHVWHSTPAIRSSRPSRRSARSGRRIADRRCARRGGGEGAREGTGLVLADGARVPSLRAIRPADRGPAVRAAADGGRGRGKHRSRDVAPYGGATHEAVFS